MNLKSWIKEGCHGSLLVQQSFISLTILLRSYLRKSTFKKLSMDQKLKVNFQNMSFIYIFSLINLSKKKKYVFYDAMLDCINSFNLFGLFLWYTWVFLLPKNRPTKEYFIPCLHLVIERCDLVEVSKHENTHGKLESKTLDQCHNITLII